MSKPRKLKRWELTRVAKKLEDEIIERTTGPYSEIMTLGDPNDIIAMRAALKILYANSEK